ncbi:triose-phosphate isomerase [Patescibacteria group bacterium]|nr:triose-phosphate isomerase [Patescibacteria group bacterium]
MKKIIIANWKCNPIKKNQAEKLFSSVKRGVTNIKKIELVICPPFVYLSEIASSSNIKLGAQDCFWKDQGAFTGEISAKMLKDLKCKYVIIGHSERRFHFKETKEMINQKIKAVLSNGMIPILCIDQINQIKENLSVINGKKMKKIIIAYEPLFAIGTGNSCSIKQAKKTNESIKGILGQDSVVLYGGSVSSKNAKDYIFKANFSGLLVGSASLNASEFVEIVKSIS